jgi:hypothetical protein
LKRFFPSAFLVPLFLVAAVFGVFGKSLAFDFVYDDHETIVDNPAVRSIENAPSFFFDRDTTSDNTPLRREIYRPLKTLSAALDYFFHGPRPAGYHLTNLLVHTATVLLLFLMLGQAGFSGFARFLPALAFAVHPALAHNVAYVSGRADMLAAVFLLSALTTSFGFSQESAPPLSWFFFLLACLSKENAAAFPLFMSAWFFYRRDSLKHALPYWIILLGYLVARSAVVGHLAQREYVGGSLAVTQASMVKAWFLYITGFFWPVKTGILPDLGVESSWMNARSLAAGALLLLFAAATVRLERRRLKVLPGAAWFVLFLLPAANWIPIKALFSWRFAYVSWIGACWSLAAVLSKMGRHGVIRIVSFVWVGALAAFTFVVIEPFRNDLALWHPMIVRAPHLSKPYRVVAAIHLREEKPEKALGVLLLGNSRIPDDPRLALDLARTLISKKRYAAALEVLRRVPDRHKRIEGKSFALTFAFAAYQARNYRAVLETVEWDAPERAPAELLTLQAHAAALLEHYSLAEILYRELLSRDISPKRRADAMNILARIRAREEKNIEPQRSQKTQK